MEFEVKAKGFTGSESNIGNPFSAYRILHIYIYSVVKKAINITLLSSSWLTLTQSIWKKIPTNNLIIAV